MAPDPGLAALAKQKRVNTGQGGFLRTIGDLWPYMWPAERPDLRRRVMVAFLLMVVTKIVTLAVPYTFKWATDGLAALGGGKALSGSTLAVALASLPLTMLVLY